VLSLQSISLFLDALERIFHKAFSFAASHSTCKSQLEFATLGVGHLTDGGSAKSPLGKGSRMNTVYDGSVDIVVLNVEKLGELCWKAGTPFLYRELILASNHGVPGLGSATLLASSSLS
jgi:hypothetical protein